MYLCNDLKTFYTYCRIVLLMLFLACGGSLWALDKPASKSAKLRIQADSAYYLERYSDALELYVKTMEQALKDQDMFNYIGCTGYIGNIYDAFGDNNSSIFYYVKGYNEAKRIGDKTLQASFLSNIVTAYCRMGNAKKARYYYNLLQNTPATQEKDNYQYYLYYEKARVLTAEQRYQEAIHVHQQAMDYAQKHNLSQLYVLFQMSEIGNLYVLMGQPQDAIKMGYVCENMSRKLRSGELLVNSYKMLADAYTQTHHADSSQRYRTLYFSLNDSVYNINKFYNARYKLSDYENRVHRTEVSSLNNRITLQVYIIVGIVFFLLLISLLTYIIYRKNRRIAHTYHLLIDKNRDLEAREEQNRHLLESYISQLDDHPTAAVSETPTTTSVISDDEDKKLLNKINGVIDDLTVISNPDFSLQMLAEAVESNTTYVSRIINTTYQKNFKTLLNERRIREACHKLANPELYQNYTMQAIYEAVGYKNATSFIRAFKKVYGMTPSEYQKLALAHSAEEPEAEDRL